MGMLFLLCVCVPGLCSVLAAWKDIRISSISALTGRAFLTHRWVMREHRGQEERELGRRENYSVQSSKWGKVMAADGS